MALNSIYMPMAPKPISFISDLAHVFYYLLRISISMSNTHFKVRYLGLKSGTPACLCAHMQVPPPPYRHTPLFLEPSPSQLMAAPRSSFQFKNIDVTSDFALPPTPYLPSIRKPPPSAHHSVASMWNGWWSALTDAFWVVSLILFLLQPPSTLTQ